MKKFCGIVALSFFIIIAFCDNNVYSKAAKQKTYVVDIQEVFNKSFAEKDINLKLETKKIEMEKKLYNLKEEIKVLSNSLKDKESILNKESIEKEQREIRIKVNDLKTLQSISQEDFNVFRQKLVFETEKKIIDIVSIIAKKNGYSMVLNKSAVLYLIDGMDITDKVLKEFNEKYSS